MPNGIGFDPFFLSTQPIAGAFDNVASGQRLNVTDGSGSFVVYYGSGSAYGTDLIVLRDFGAPVPEPSAFGIVSLASLWGLTRRWPGRRARR